MSRDDGADTEEEDEWLTDGQVVPLLWRPWYLDRLASPKGTAWVWSIVQGATGLEDPAEFPTFATEWSEEQQAMLGRYVAVADRLVATSMMNSPGGIKIDLLRGGVTKSGPAEDAALGFSALLRQVFKPAEEASFNRVRNALRKAARDADATEAGRVLGLWKRTHETLLRSHLRLLVHGMAKEAGLLDDLDESEDGGRLGIEEVITPAELIETFLHGDLLHWGSGRARLKAWSQTPTGAAQVEFEMRNDAHMLAHFYVGFAAIVRQSLPGSGEPR